MSKKDKPYKIRCLAAIESLLGSRTELCERLNVNYGTITNWHTSENIPSKWILPISNVSDGKFTCEDLLSDEQNG